MYKPKRREGGPALRGPMWADEGGHGLRSSPWANEGGWLGLVSMLIALVIICILAVYLLGGPGAFQRGGQAGQEPAGGVLSPGGVGGVGGAMGALSAARKVECGNNLQQARYALQIFQGNTGRLPSSLEELAGARPNLQLKCPVGGEPYQYDPDTGRIWCVHPGHERL